MKFHAETCCRFDRYHANLGKTADLMMCPFCHAGQQGMPFEELDDTPLWTNSMFATRPWPADDSPHLATIPYDSFGRREAMFSLDPFHVSKVGLIRDVVGSLLVIMCRVGFFDTASDSRDINERLTRAHSSFRLWCAANHKSPGLRSLTRAYLNAKTFSTSPWTNSKGSDSMLLAKWLCFYTGLMLETEPQGLERFLRVARKVFAEHHWHAWAAWKPRPFPSEAMCPVALRENDDHLQRVPHAGPNGAQWLQNDFICFETQIPWPQAFGLGFENSNWARLRG